MPSPRRTLGWLSLVAGVLWAGAGTALAQSSAPQPTKPSPHTLPAPLPAQLPLNELPVAIREQVRKITDKPTLSARGPTETFSGRPALYQWLLDHPDRAAAAWQRLGTPCLEICDRGNGRFGWCDTQGSDLYWETIYRGPSVRIWYAEARGRPSLLLPQLSARAVVVLHHWEEPDAAGRPRLHHQADLYLHTDSRTTAFVARMIGPSAPRMTEQCVSQLEMFFSTLTRYLDHHPERAEMLLFGR
jgi:hypothetical protein